MIATVRTDGVQKTNQKQCEKTETQAGPSAQAVKVGQDGDVGISS